MNEAETWGAIGATLLGGGGFVGWYRERRKWKKDANDFALSMVKAQNDRIDQLVFQVGELSGRVAELSAERSRLLVDNAELKSEVSRLKVAIQVEMDKATVLLAQALEAKGSV